MSLLSYPIRRIGPLAMAELEITQPAQLLGSTSRGLFVLTGSGKVIFISGEAFAGPWTANLNLSPNSLPPAWHELVKGKQVQIQARRIIIPSARAYFDAAGAQRWEPPERNSAPDLPGLPARRDEVSRLLLEGGERGLSPVLAGEPDAIPDALVPIQDLVDQLYASLCANDTPTALQAGERLLGFGGGLTPSGDDLLCGLLLGLSRWGAALGWAVPPEFAPALLASARLRTTALSASLLEAAALGMADERLLLAADGLLTGSAAPEAIAKALLGYGNSSGLDFWIGLKIMTLII